MFRFAFLVSCAALVGCSQERSATPAAAATEPQVVAVALQDPPPAPPPSPFADCPAGLLPVHRVAPQMPRELHQEFAGEATTAFVVAPSGAVSDVRIESAEWEPVGHGGGDPRLLEASILAAMTQWRYPPREAACLQREPLRFVFPD